LKKEIDGDWGKRLMEIEKRRLVEIEKRDYRKNIWQIKKWKTINH
jgi:hypothetical protein